MNTSPFADVDIIRWLYHPQIRQAPQSPTQDPNKPGDIDIFLLVRRAAAAVAQRDQEDALIGLWFIWPEVKMIRELLDRPTPPSEFEPGD